MIKCFKSEKGSMGVYATGLTLTFIIILMITCTIYAPLLMGHYATDTYNIINVGYTRYAIEWSLKDGRIFMS